MRSAKRQDSLLLHRLHATSQSGKTPASWMDASRSSTNPNQFHCVSTSAIPIGPSVHDSLAQVMMLIDVDKESSLVTFCARAILLPKTFLKRKEDQVRRDVLYRTAVLWRGSINCVEVLVSNLLLPSSARRVFTGGSAHCLKSTRIVKPTQISLPWTHSRSCNCIRVQPLGAEKPGEARSPLSGTVLNGTLGSWCPS